MIEKWNKMVVGLLTVGIFSILPLHTFAAETTKIDSGDTAWILAANAIVVFMFVPGLALFYGGLVGERNVINTLMLSFSSMLVVSIVWVLWGYTLTYGTSINGLIGGLDYLGFKGVGPEAAFGTLTIPHYLFAAFQICFAAITVGIVSGGVTGRVAFPAWLAFCVLWPTFVYAPIAHWTWGGGWISKIGELDFAGGTVVHILSGVSALVAALVIGPRRQQRNQAPHNIVFFLIGAASLWFGWLAFNGGTALAAGEVAALAFANTQVAACAGGVGWMLIEWIVRKHPTLVGAMIGAVSALVAITPAAGYVTVLSALVIGLLAAPVCYFGVHYIKERFRYDDTLDAFGVHGLGAIWGGIATGIFATVDVNPAGGNGLLYGNPGQLGPQLLGIVVAIVLAVVGTYVVLKVIQLFTPLRVSEENEELGLDLSVHEEVAYTSREDLLHPPLAATKLEKEMS